MGLRTTLGLKRKTPSAQASVVPVSPLRNETAQVPQVAENKALKRLYHQNPTPISETGRLRAYLTETGWTASVDANRPIDRHGNPLPWFTYPAIEFLTARLPANISVFEYGAGYSTLWWKQRASRVVSCEHEREWVAELHKLRGDLEIVLRSLGGDYEREISNYESEFDVIVIDGRNRVECAKHALYALKPAGFFVWDNSDRHRYEDGYAFLESTGFKRVDFHGMGPINSYGWCTSLFYRGENCLGL